MSEPKITSIQIDTDNLYKEESFSDLTYVTIRRLTPVNVDGSVDESRDTLFTGMAQLMSPNGPVPIHCAIEGATSLEDAIKKMPDAVDRTVRAMIEEAQEMERKESSKLIVP